MYHNHYNAYNWNTGANYSQSWGGAPSGDLKDEAKAIFGDKKYLQQLKDAKTDAAKAKIFATTEAGALVNALETFQTKYSTVTQTDKTAIDTYHDDSGNSGPANKDNGDWLQEVIQLSQEELQPVLKTAIEGEIGGGGAIMPPDTTDVDKMITVWEKLKGITGYTDSDPTKTPDAAIAAFKAAKGSGSGSGSGSGFAAVTTEVTAPAPAASKEILGIPTEKVSEINQLAKNINQPIPSSYTKAERNAVEFFRSASQVNFPSGTKVILAPGLEYQF